MLFESTTRSLLKLGKGGVTEAHANSLSEFLKAHPMVGVLLVHLPQTTGHIGQNPAFSSARTCMMKGAVCCMPTRTLTRMGNAVMYHPCA
jgi:hypothetical protein